MRKQVDVVNDSTDTVLESIHAIMHLYRARQYRALRDSALDLTHMEAKALGFFVRHPGATQSELVAHSGRDKAQLARLVRSLRDKGLLEGQVNEGDRRRELLQPTEAGRALFRSVEEEGGRLAAVAVTGLEGEECRQLLALLGKVRRNLEGEEPV